MLEKNQCDQTEMYSEIYVKSFNEAVYFLSEKASLLDNKFCIVDIDGTLYPSTFVKLPGISHFVSSDIPSDIAHSFALLKTDIFFEDNLVIATNRNKHENFFWNSGKVLKNVIETCNVPVVSSLNKQFPGLAKKQCNELVGNIVRYGIGKSDLIIFTIEDFSLVCPNRADFLTYISQGVEKEIDCNVRVVNLVIKK